MAYQISRDPNARGLGAQIGQQLGALYAPPSMTEAAAVQNARIQQELRQRQAEANAQIAALYGPYLGALAAAGQGAHVNDFERARLTAGSPNRVDYLYPDYRQSPGGQNVAEGAATGRTVLEQQSQDRRNAADNRRAVAVQAITPLAENTVRVPMPSIAGMYAMPELAQGAVGSTVTRPGETRTVPGAPTSPSVAAVAGAYDPSQFGPRVSRLAPDGSAPAPPAIPAVPQAPAALPGTAVIQGRPTAEEIKSADMQRGIAAMQAGGMPAAVAAGVGAGVPVDQSTRALAAARAAQTPDVPISALDPVVYALGGNAGNTFAGAREAQTAAQTLEDSKQSGETHRTGMTTASNERVVDINGQNALERELSGPLPAGAVRNIVPTAAARVGLTPAPAGQPVTQVGVLEAPQGAVVVPPVGQPVQGQVPNDTRQVLNYQILDGSGQVVDVRPSRDGGRTNSSTGMPLLGAGERAGQAVAVQANDPRAVAGATNTNITDANRIDAEIASADVLTSEVRRLMAENPGIFGLPGFIQGTVQNVQQTLRESLAAAGQTNPEIARVGQEMDRTLAQYAPQYFNPNIPKAQRLMFDMAYMLARMQDDKGEVSRQEFEKNLNSLTQGWLGNTAAVNATLDAIDVLKQSRRAASASLRNPRGVAQPGAPAPQSAAAPAAVSRPALARPTTEDEYNQMPRGTHFLDPAGVERVKP